MRAALFLVLAALSAPAHADTATPGGGTCGGFTTGTGTATEHDSDDPSGSEEDDKGCNHVGHMLNPVSGASVAIGFGLLLGIRRKREDTGASPDDALR